MYLDVILKQFVERVTVEDFAKYIDHTLIKPDTTIDIVLKDLELAKSYNFASIVVSPYHAKILLTKYKDVVKDVRLCTVIGFPMGYDSTLTKVAQARELMELGVAEIDMVMNIQAFKEGDYDYVIQDISAVRDVVKSSGGVLKVIIETGLLNDEEKKKASEIVMKAGADFVKTCTGFLGGRATIHDVVLIRSVVGDRIRIKASGGIRTAIETIMLILAGASRIGTSSGIFIVKQYQDLRQKLL